jgi:hypothetical protein
MFESFQPLALLVRQARANNDSTWDAELKAIGGIYQPEMVPYVSWTDELTQAEKLYLEDENKKWDIVGKNFPGWTVFISPIAGMHRAIFRSPLREDTQYAYYTIFQ